MTKIVKRITKESGELHLHVRDSLAILLVQRDSQGQGKQVGWFSNERIWAGVLLCCMTSAVVANCLNLSFLIWKVRQRSTVKWTQQTGHVYLAGLKSQLPTVPTKTLQHLGPQWLICKMGIRILIRAVVTITWTRPYWSVIWHSWQY